MTGAKLLAIRPHHHPHRGKPSTIRVSILLERKGQPIVTHDLTMVEALRLLEDLSAAIRVVGVPLMDNPL